MREWADYTLEEPVAGGRRLVFTGPMTVSSLGPIDARLRTVEAPLSEIDLSQVGEIDTVGAWVAWRVASEHEARIVGGSDKAERLIAAVGAGGLGEAAGRARPNAVFRALEAIGLLIVTTARGTKGITAFLGAILIDLWDLIRHPSRVRIKAVVRQLELVGVNSLGIIGLMCFLVGIVITQLGSEQLRDYGLEGFTVNLTGRISMRELGVLMAAIMVAGRSGSAFAAQIGTMKLTEEIDAMRTIGVSPIEALVIPRLASAVLMMPLLGFYAATMAIVGGAFIASLMLKATFFGFLGDIRHVVPLKDVWVCLIKAPFFGAVIALAGCYQGLQVSTDSEEVGTRTTMAVVQAIFMVIVMDAFFAVFFSKVGWG